MNTQPEAMKLALEGAANYIDVLGGDSRKYRQALAEQPAQQEPLTDEEIESVNVRLAGSRDLACLFARAIEAAHGIKENT